MNIIITGWAFDSYLDLKNRQIFDAEEYRKTLRPGVLLLKTYPNDPFFNSSKFWSQATDSAKNRIPHGFKMKWHQIGNGKVQLRLPVGVYTEAYLCEAYVKKNEVFEKRQMARFKTHLALINNNRFTVHGRLS
ncbi:MAG: hypothetical protein QNJ97_09050 [Myxococcota bacterium]|nr:hypothetical protein [Myxococcota bacterium]